MHCQQSELQLAETSGGRYQVGSHIAAWRHRSGDEKIIDLSFRGKAFEITRERSTPNGRPRMFINGIRQPDGKLFQGRCLLELVRKLDDLFDDFIEIPARLERMERKLDVLVARGPRVAKTKLCLVRVKATWPQERYVPNGSLGGFARVPIPTIAASQYMAAGEYRLLQAILFCAQGTGLLTAGKKKLAKLARVPESHVKDYRKSLHNRQIIRPTGHIGKHGVKEFEVLTHPWLCDVENILEGGQKCAGNVSEGGQKCAAGGQKCALRGPTVGPLKNNKITSNKSEGPNKTTRPQAAGAIRPHNPEFGNELLDRLLALCGPDEMKQNAVAWRNRAQDAPGALTNAIEDLELRQDNYHLERVKNPAAYIVHQFEAYRGKIQRSENAIKEVPAKSLSELVRESLDSASESGDRPALTEVFEFCEQTGIDGGVAEIWWNEMQSIDWIAKESQRRIADWRAHLAAYWRNWENNKKRFGKRRRATEAESE